MAAWETDDDYLSGPAAVGLPTPHDTPYRTPSRASKKSQRRSATPPPPSSSPPLIPTTSKSSKRTSANVATDESVSLLDPRRFTPTLHANLVSEILALRRDQEEKIRLIESLEANLNTSREEYSDYQARTSDTAKENRSLKRQLALLEGGTSSALGELARERDEAVDGITDVKRRLEASQKKCRNQELDSERMHDLWQQEKQAWEEERRRFERKLHVSESRMKTVLEEVAAYQASQANDAHSHGMHHESDGEESDGVHAKDHDARSVRTMSLTNSVRFSMNAKPNGNSLADELNFDTDEDHTDAEGRESALSFRATSRHGRNLSRGSIADRMHRRNMSVESSKRPESTRGRLFANGAVLEALEGEDETEPQAANPTPPSYTDTGVQFSPPPSPKIAPIKIPSPTAVLASPSISPTIGSVRHKVQEIESPQRAEFEIEANQRRKRVQIPRPLTVEAPTASQQMVSSGSQTTEPLSPPKMPGQPTRVATPPPPTPTILVPMTDGSTQTNTSSPSPRKNYVTLPPPPPIPVEVPSISIQPPNSRPTTPKEPRLPQYFKHFGCQVNLVASSVSTADAAVQTEGIQIDKRLALLPAHLQPSSITSRPSSPNPASPVAELEKPFAPVDAVPPPRNPRRLASRGNDAVPPSPAASSYAIEETQEVSTETRDTYPGNNDDGPLSNGKNAPARRPQRFSSLFAGFDTASSDEADEFGDDLSDYEYRTALSAPRPISTSSKNNTRNSFPTAPTSPEEPQSAKSNGMSSVKAFGTEIHSSFSLADKENGGPKTGAVRGGKAESRVSAPPPAASAASNRASVMRKAALIQSGISTHQGRARSPSLPEANNPPFPIPKRASSRMPAASAPTSDGQRSPTAMDPFYRNVRGYRNSYRPPSIRKVRSAAALPRHQRHRRQGSRSPPPLSPSTEAPESPGLPPMPRNDITTPRPTETRDSHYRRHRHEASTNTDNTAPTDAMSFAANGIQTNGVVDAIAQTMVGEWMFKYVRRRKSFTADASGKDDNSNDRHKRWVWLAPYERSILWSSKQPTSGGALLGKAGRKLVIQSVLDVKDDNPAPKGSPPIFNRSILILTPQRALKFTASSSERHYIWLTALSFLAHSQQAVPEIRQPAVSAPKQEPVIDFDPPMMPKPKRGGIRDSIRLAKGRNPVSAKAGTPSIPSLPSVPSSQMGDVSSYRVPDSANGTLTTSHTRELSGQSDAAQPPMIHRFHDRGPPPVHSRKRSNTGGHIPPPLSFRGFSSPPHHAATNSTAGSSVGTAGSSDIYQQSQGSSQAATSNWGTQTAGSQRTSGVSDQSRPGGNFFDAIGTVRMEAFISPLGQMDHDVARRRSKEARRRRSRSRTRDSYNSRRGHGHYRGRGSNGVEDDFFRDDPFKGF